MSNGAVTLNFHPGVFKRLSILSLSLAFQIFRYFDFSDFPVFANFAEFRFFETACSQIQTHPGTRNSQVYPRYGSTMVPFSPLVTLTSDQKTRRPLPRPPLQSHLPPPRPLRHPTPSSVPRSCPNLEASEAPEMNIHLQPYSAPKNVAHESFTTSSARQCYDYQFSLAHSVALSSKTKLTPPPSSPS